MKYQSQIVLEGLVKITAEQLMADDARNYNPQEWEKMVKRFVGYGSEFYKIPKDIDGYSYARFYAVYPMEDGTKVFSNNVGYTSTMTNNGFCRIEIDEAKGTVERFLFSDGKGNFGRAENEKNNRKLMSIASKEKGHIFSNCL